MTQKVKVNNLIAIVHSFYLVDNYSKCIDVFESKVEGKLEIDLKQLEHKDLLESVIVSYDKIGGFEKALKYVKLMVNSLRNGSIDASKEDFEFYYLYYSELYRKLNRPVYQYFVQLKYLDNNGLDVKVHQSLEILESRFIKSYLSPALIGILLLTIPLTLANGFVH